MFGQDFTHIQQPVLAPQLTTTFVSSDVSKAGKAKNAISALWREDVYMGPVTSPGSATARKAGAEDIAILVSYRLNAWYPGACGCIA